MKTKVTIIRLKTLLIVIYLYRTEYLGIRQLSVEALGGLLRYL